MMKKALMIGTYVNAPYHPFDQVDAVLSGALAPAFDCQVTGELSRLRDLKGFDLCVSYLDAYDSVLPPECAASILQFVRDGGGLLCLHNGISLQTDERMFHLIGGKFLRHPPQEPLAFIPEPGGFLADCGGFVFQEEPYRFELSGDPVQMLLTYAQGGQTWPAGWCRTEGKGRVVFLTPGHSIRTFLVPTYLEMIYKSAVWAGRAE